MTKRRFVILLIAAGVGLCIVIRWANFVTARKQVSQSEQGQLAPCPDSPNCVSTQANDPRHRMEPLPLDEPPESALQRLKQIIESLPRNSIVEQKRNYLRAEFRSAWLGFVDDVEFLVDTVEKCIHFRSASRVGHYDFDVNRKRMEEIRKQYLNLVESTEIDEQLPKEMEHDQD